MISADHPIPAKLARSVYEHVFDAADDPVGGVFVGRNEQPAGVRITGAVPGSPYREGAWEQLRTAMQQYFPNDRVVGWYHSRPGKGVGLGEKDERLHRAAFHKSDQFFLLIDPHRGREAIYSWVGDRLVATHTGDTPLPGTRPGRDDDPPARRDRSAVEIALALLPAVAVGIGLGIVAWLLIAPDGFTATTDALR